MMIRIKRLLVFILLPCATVLTLSQCTQAPEKSKEEQPSENAESGSFQEAFFQIPMPGELFLTLKEYKVVPKSGLLHDTDKITRYSTSKDKAINFGIYSSDLFYCSIFSQKADVLKYFDNLKKLSDDLGISSSITDETIKRIELNLGNSDSLNVITNDVFYQVSTNLEKNDQEATLALVLAGGLIETIYLSVELLDKWKPADKAIQFVADQKYSVENLLNYFDQYKDDQRVSETNSALSKLGAVFAAIKEVDVNQVNSATGIRTIGATKRLEMSKEDFDALRIAVSEARIVFTKGDIN